MVLWESSKPVELESFEKLNVLDVGRARALSKFRPWQISRGNSDDRCSQRCQGQTSQQYISACTLGIVYKEGMRGVLQAACSAMALR